jgi:hypothetical protein
VNKETILQLWAWQYSRTGCFSNQLFDLIQKADPSNKERLRRGFPEHVQAFDEWCAAGNYGDDLFDRYGIDRRAAQV